ncbi:Fructose-bisphosphate aldolase [Nosema granulosis]|uniref:fructose-bisphosphate aldolase n=1 Tax=Nosema granulosis TaxID=83296 RepID=A0A9P6KZ62_9MICR|nr:Fructose-bisphosphate aldolase [Nosema granulosis]
MSSPSEKCFKLGMVAKQILENNKGILAADESPGSIQKRFDKLGIINNEETRRSFRELLFTSEGIEKYIGGVILHEETFEQKDESEKLFIDMLKEKGICLGIKLDKGLIDYKNNEKVSVGLEDLHLRVKYYCSKGAVFAKWRSLFIVKGDNPTEDCIYENCTVLAKYAKICQNNNLVPIVEPEVYFEGNYTIDEAEQQSKRILSTLIQKLNIYEVYIPAVIIKMSFVTQGKENKRICKPHEVGRTTMNTLVSAIPCGIPGIVFLSGGHTQDDAISYLNAINKCKAYKTWSLSFSYGRCLSEKPMETWRGIEENKKAAQREFIEIARRCHLACRGDLEEE